MKKFNIGLFGFGVVGEGIYQVLSQKPSSEVEIVKVCIKENDKPRKAPRNLFTNNPNEILDDPSIDVVVELINDSEAAFSIISKAIKNGKHVVTANKKMVAQHHSKLIRLQDKHKVSILYEAAVCGSIPILRNLEDYFGNEELSYLSGIVNGSTNYILTRMHEMQEPYEIALETAKQKGFAEADPASDVEGWDAGYKLSILGLHAFGKFFDTADIVRKGIDGIQPEDHHYAREKGYKIKLLATLDSTDNSCATVLPTFVSRQNSLSNVDYEYNAVLIGSSLADDQFLYGKGAGRFPTSAAVLSDIFALKSNYKYSFKKGRTSGPEAAKGLKKFYLSFKKNADVDLSIFEEVEEKNINKGKTYLIGWVDLAKLQNYHFWKKRDVSLIAFE